MSNSDGHQLCSPCGIALRAEVSDKTNNFVAWHRVNRAYQIGNNRWQTEDYAVGRDGDAKGHDHAEVDLSNKLVFKKAATKNSKRVLLLTSLSLNASLAYFFLDPSSSVAFPPTLPS